MIHFSWLVVRPDVPAIEHFEETHEMWLCPHATLTAAFDAAGFDVRWEESGFMRDRGLLVGRRRDGA